MSMEVGNETPVHASAIARQLGVTRQRVSDLRREAGFPVEVAPQRWLMSDVRAYLRSRAKAGRPTASCCSSCGGQL